MQCINCLGEIPDSVTQCPLCGWHYNNAGIKHREALAENTVETFEQGTKDLAVDTYEEQNYICPNCHSVVPMTALKCPACGVSLHDTNTSGGFCPHCHAKTDLGDITCKTCGGDLLNQSKQAPFNLNELPNITINPKVKKIIITVIIACFALSFVIPLLLHLFMAFIMPMLIK